MRDELKETAIQYQELEERITELTAEIKQVRRDTFGAESENTEQKARELFSEVGGAETGQSKTSKIDSLQEERQDAVAKRDNVKEDLLDLLVNVTFPLNEEIETDNGSISFPYKEEIQQQVLDGIALAIGEDLDSGAVSIETNRITVETGSVDEAIDAVQEKVRKIRQSAEGLLDINSHVESLHDRDEKVAGMLYVLYACDEDSLTKKELEERMGLESGDLRGQLYHVLNGDPYLKKQDRQISLRSIGQEVIEEYIQRHDIPDLLSDEPDDTAEEDRGVVE